MDRLTKKHQDTSENGGLKRVEKMSVMADLGFILGNTSRPKCRKTLKLLAQ